MRPVYFSFLFIFNKLRQLCSGISYWYALSNTLGNPFKDYTSKLSKSLLQVSVVLMGFGLNLNRVIELGPVGISFAISSVLVTVILGMLLIKIINLPFNTGFLITVGTAIWGSSP